MQHGSRAQMTLTLGALLGQNMTAMRFISLEATGGLFEPFGSTTIGFDFRHFSLLLMDEYKQPRQCR
jgi:hypothetical protein